MKFLASNFLWVFLGAVVAECVDGGPFETWKWPALFALVVLLVFLRDWGMDQ